MKTLAAPLLLCLLACGDAAPARPVGTTARPTAEAAAPVAASHRLLLLAGPHAITEAHWTAGRVAARSEQELWFADPEHPDATRVVTPPAPITKLVTHPGSTVVAVVTEDGRVLTYEHGALLHELAPTADRQVDAVSPDGRFLLVSARTSSQVSVYDTHSGAVVSSFDQDEGYASFDPTGTFLLRAGTLVRVQDGKVLKTWHESNVGAMYEQGWTQGRAVVFDEKVVHLIDPTTLVVKDVKYECKPNGPAADFLDAAHGTILHLCGGRAQLVDPTNGAVTRVKLPLLPSEPITEVRADAEGKVLLDARAQLADAPQFELSIDPAAKRATVIDLEAMAEREPSWRGPTFDERNCVRRVGQSLASTDWCTATESGAGWLASAAGSFAVAKAGREVLRVGARAPTVRAPTWHLVGGTGLGGYLDDDGDGQKIAPGVRWKLGEPTDTKTVRLDDVADRRCRDGVALPNGHVVAVCFHDAGGSSKKRRGFAVPLLVELGASHEVVAERRAADSAHAVVLTGGHVVVYSHWEARPGLGTEYAGPPSTCGEDCAPLATYAFHRDFAVRLGADGTVQTAGTFQPGALACIDAEGLAHPYETCAAPR